ncbi:hypothetical protein BJY04DRAFT_177308 [Aspergillus karnatakaensis]|uniref:NmrA/HSCARG family protein n=1 Tax=Aspergillus karnatakaensis TaxID=1810916 RepID=UPI003CCD0D95
MSKKIITVVGATGAQGGSVITALLNSPVYSIRAITRSPQSDAARALVEKGVEVVQADLNNIGSLRSAFDGSHAIFAVTNFFDSFLTIGIQKSMDNETQQGINLANAAAATDSLEHYVWSTLPNTRQNSGGRAVVPYFESKNRVDSHIRSLPDLLQKTTFVWIGWYASNILMPTQHPTRIHTIDGSNRSYVQFISVPPSTLVPLLGDEKINPGLFVKAILEQPQKTLPGKIVSGVDETRPFNEVLAWFAAVHGIEARSVQILSADYVKMWPVLGETADLTNQYLSLMDGKGFSSVEEEVLTKEDLDVKGLVGTAEALKSVPLLG